ncbi:unnamed protein product [Psylliodes chrysocephalus]|uniref:BAG domain-containing protein n=1 Tax=Psylliodes chrysocephalus TaxID=3402493 RepID=A0A9P0CVD8_9CUCU|nr:unnamed protein product [Psylliodes chrysocephala]
MMNVRCHLSSLSLSTKVLFVAVILFIYGMSFPRSSYAGFPFKSDATGDEFPFNRRGSRDANLQSTLDDIAQRHPKFAKHLTNLKKPFGDHSRFPFEEDDIDLDQYIKQFYNSQGLDNPEEFYPRASSHQEQPKQNNSTSPPSDFQPSKAQQDCSKQPKTVEKEVNSNLQQSSTTDLGQRQEPIDDRNQRSSSAPPGGDTKKRFTSSINIPINTPPENMAQPNPNQHQDSKPVERIIPIQMEGRDGPIIPKNTHIPQQNQPAQARHEQSFPRRGFSDEQFSRQGFPEEHFSRHNVPSQFSREEIPIPVQKDTSKTQQQSSQQHTHQEQEPRSEPPKVSTPIQQIQMIKEDVSKLMEQVEQFTGKTKDKQYIYLDEMLTRNLLKLDDIDTQGQENIRVTRKEAIKCIQAAISLLETKATGNVSTKTEVDQQQQQQQQPEKSNSKQDDLQKMDTESSNEPSEKMDTAETKDEALNSETCQETRAVLVSNPQNNDESNASGNLSDNSDGQESNEKKLPQ